MSKPKVTIILDDYNYQCWDWCCTNYGTITTVNWVECEYHNDDRESLVEFVLQQLWYEYEIINKYNWLEQ